MKLSKKLINKMENDADVRDIVHAMDCLVRTESESNRIQTVYRVGEIFEDAAIHGCMMLVAQAFGMPQVHARWCRRLAKLIYATDASDMDRKFSTASIEPKTTIIRMSAAIDTREHWVRAMKEVCGLDMTCAEFVEYLHRERWILGNVANQWAIQLRPISRLARERAKVDLESLIRTLPVCERNHTEQNTDRFTETWNEEFNKLVKRYVSMHN